MQTQQGIRGSDGTKVFTEAAALYPEDAWDGGIVSSRHRPVTKSAMLIFLIRNMSNIPTPPVLGLL